jgi:hypothetical protein
VSVVNGRKWPSAQRALNIIHKTMAVATLAPGNPCQLYQHDIAVLVRQTLNAAFLRGIGQHTYTSSRPALINSRDK